MSLEQLLLIVFLLIVPLLEYVVRRVRETGTPPNRPAPESRPVRRRPQALPQARVPQPAAPPTVPLPPPPMPSEPPSALHRPEVRPPITLEGTSLEKLGPEIGAPVSSPQVGRDSRRPAPWRRSAIIGSPEELRRAIVIAIVLGPCRATDSRQGGSDVLRI